MELNWIPFILAFIAISLYVYKHLKDVFSYFEVRGIPYIKPNLIFGNSLDVILCRVSMVLQQMQMYRELAPHRYGGMFTMQNPMLIVRDPELIKKVLTKDFRCFHDRGIKFDFELEPLGRHLFAMSGEEWKNLRIKMTTTFSTGKMKAMIPLIEECALELESVLNNFNAPGDVDIKDILGCYTMDVIGSCAFGLDVNSLKNPNSDFRRMCKKFFEFRYASLIRSLFPNLSPKLVKLFGLTFIGKDITKFFVALVKDTVEYRAKNNVSRNDFLNLLINMKNDFDMEQAKKSAEVEMLNDLMPSVNTTTVDMTIEVMAAQCFLFLGAGFETSASTMAFLLFEVAQQTEIQDKLKAEMDKVLAKYDNQLSYYALKEMKYLDMVLEETLRKYPPAPMIIRMCTSNYKVPEADTVIPDGLHLMIPVLGLHYDEEYYKDPEKFNPENFDEDVKSQRPQYAYLPFGEGPRICIAERFAKLVMKMAIVHVIRNYKFQLSPKMKLPIQFANSFGLLAVKGGIWLQYEKRTR